MSEIEESAKLVDELTMESLEDDEPVDNRSRWHKQVALSSLILALLTALGGLLAGVTAGESVFERTTEILEVSRLEGDRISVEILAAKHDILATLGEEPDPAEIAQIQAFLEEAEQLTNEARREEELAQSANSAHLILAVAVTVLSVGITLGGMSVVVEEKRLWLVGIVIGAGGALGLAFGIVRMLT